MFNSGFFSVLGVDEDRSVHPEKQKGQQSCDVGGGGRDGDDSAKGKDGRCDDSWSKVAESSQSSDSEKAGSGGQPMEPEPGQPLIFNPTDSAQKNSARTRRALFARRRLDASASVPSTGAHSPTAQPLTPRREPSPPHSPSPRPPQPHAPPPTLSPNSCHISASPLRPVSPVRGLSPVITQPHGSESSGPPGSLADSSAQYQPHQHPRDRPATGRLVSPLSHCSNTTVLIDNNNFLFVCLCYSLDLLCL